MKKRKKEENEKTIEKKRKTKKLQKMVVKDFKILWKNIKVWKTCKRVTKRILDLSSMRKQVVFMRTGKCQCPQLLES